MPRGQRSGLAARSCALPDCPSTFTPIQTTQRFCTPSHRHDAKRLRRALPLAINYLERVMAELEREREVVA